MFSPAGRLRGSTPNGDPVGSPRKGLCLDVFARPVQENLSSHGRATNKAAVRGVTVLNQTDDKSRTLNQHNLLLFAGEPGDTVQFAEFIQANVQLYGMKNDTELNSDAVAAFTRREMADNLRTRVRTQHINFEQGLMYRMHIKCC
jgi:hypothetical protein